VIIIQQGSLKKRERWSRVAPHSQGCWPQSPTHYIVLIITKNEREEGMAGVVFTADYAGAGADDGFSGPARAPAGTLPALAVSLTWWKSDTELS
jgi:hypothetical protein